MLKYIYMQLTKSTKINSALYNMGIASHFQVIEHLPRSYESLLSTHESGLKDKEKVVFYGRVVGAATCSRFTSISVCKFSFITNNGAIFKVEAWNRPYLSSQLNNDDYFTLIANFDLKKNKLNLIRIIKGIPNSDNLIEPIYSLPKVISNYIYSRLVKKSFQECEGKIYNVVPSYFMKKYRLESRQRALLLAHEPKSMSDVYQGLRVLKYEECLLFSLKTQLIRKANQELRKNSKQHIDATLINQLVKTLPYKLTKSQIIAIREIVEDMNKENLMYRLLQGDVGTGKTLVAALALYANYLRNDQGAFLVPTDSLARQHFVNLRKLFKDTDVKVALLLGSTPLKERSEIRLGLINKQIDIVIGTHVLFSEDINYLSLGLAIIDEQHKFGVNQRLQLASKGSHADLLLMSATPIPRTLALSLYGDLDVSTLVDFPNKNKSITTKICKTNDKQIDILIQESIDTNKRVYIVAPLIDEGETDSISVEKLYATYLLKFKGKVSLLHGKMKQEEKEEALSSFANGKTPILISTTVIEVGIDIKEANLMIIYSPTNFGLASLHQLRGRIGRDGSQANCLLLYDGSEEDEMEKLNILCKSCDGFYIAEEDLKRRGPGQLGGYKQSGLPNFNFANLIDDIKIFEASRDDAKFILENENQSGFSYILRRAKKEILLTDFTNV